MRSKIFFRFETDFNIGLGHAIRSLRVANFLKKKNFIVNIITSKKSYNILKTLKVGNIKIILIDRTTNNLKDANLTLDEINKHSKNEKIYIFKDNYHLNLIWDKTIRKKFKNLIILDDFLTKKHDCKIYINFNPYTKKDVKYKNKATKYLIGLKYFPNVKRIKKNPSNFLCLIYFGGSDKFNYSLKILKILKNIEFSNIKFLFILSKFNHKKNLIKKIIDRDKNFKVIESFNNMNNIYSKVSHAIGTGGTTLWEIINNNIYPLIIPTHKNHLKPCKFLSKRKRILLIKNFKNHKKIYDYLQSMPKKVNNTQIIDNNGLKRIFRVINETK